MAPKNITIKEFESMITTCTLCEKLADKKGHVVKEFFTREELLLNGTYAAADVIKNLNLNNIIWARIRRNKVFLFCEKSNTILAELAVVADKVSDNIYAKPYFILLDRKGFVRANTVNDLILSCSVCRRKGVNNGM